MYNNSFISHCGNIGSSSSAGSTDNTNLYTTNREETLVSQCRTEGGRGGEGGVGASFYRKNQ